VSGNAYVAVLVVQLHFPDASSLKGKRRELQRIKAQLQGRLGAAVAETAHHDRWQLAELTAALTARSARDAEAIADAAERWLHAYSPEGVRVERLLASVEDLRGFPASLRVEQ
jgi:uncharacterized protein YlxP (DUF503 family)